MNFISLFVLNIIIGIAATWIFEFILKTNRKLRERYYKRHEILFGYHVHHSTIGLLFLAASVILFLLGEISSFLMISGIGIGIIIMHTISSHRFVFIEKESFK